MANTIINKLTKDREFDFVVLASTNSAVENIYQICYKMNSSLINRDNFKTIYSFFRIDYQNDIILGAIDMPENIYIDEFSLINKYLFKKCLSNMRMKGCKNLTICGDVMQLNAVYKDKQYISFEKFYKWNSIYELIQQKMNKQRMNELFQQRMNEQRMNNSTVSSSSSTPSSVNNPTVSLINNIYPKVLEHLHMNIFGMKVIQNSKLINLTINRRSNSTIRNILTQIYAKNKNPALYNFAHFLDLPKLITTLNYTFIASRYKTLQQVYDYIYSSLWSTSNSKPSTVIDILHIKQSVSFSSGFKDLYLYPGMSIISCDTDEKNKKYINGEELTFTGNIENDCLKCINGFNEVVYVHKIKEIDKVNSNEFFPICPSFLMTIHKSQGRTLNNVIVCIDDLFDMCMMYTAITRAKDNLLFYSREKNEIKRINIKKLHKTNKILH